ncbi:ARSK, partial [Symbiodinium sp. KB8]
TSPPCTMRTGDWVSCSRPCAAPAWRRTPWLSSSLTMEALSKTMAVSHRSNCSFPSWLVALGCSGEGSSPRTWSL